MEIAEGEPDNRRERQISVQASSDDPCIDIGIYHSTTAEGRTRSRRVVAAVRHTCVRRVVGRGQTPPRCPRRSAALAACVRQNVVTNCMRYPWKGRGASNVRRQSCAAPCGCAGKTASASAARSAGGGVGGVVEGAARAVDVQRPRYLRSKRRACAALASAGLT